MTASGDETVDDEDLTAEDRVALSWAVSSEHPLGAAIVARIRAGGTGVTSSELASIQQYWNDVGRPVPQHHVHRTRVSFDDGTAVVGVSFAADDPYQRDAAPAFGLYLDERWDPPWPHAHIEWPDFGVPADVPKLRRALLDVLTRARAGETVELGCLGGHGRTGTALACLAVLTGTPSDRAVEWVREHYCARAVETDEQHAFVRAFAP